MSNTNFYRKASNKPESRKKLFETLEANKKKASPSPKDQLEQAFNTLPPRLKANITRKETNILTDNILNALRRFNIDAWRQNNLAVKGRKFVGKYGIPDICGQLPDGRWLGIEIKARKRKGRSEDKLREAQQVFFDNTNARGGLCFRCTTYKEFQDLVLPKLRKYNGVFDPATGKTIKVD